MDTVDFYRFNVGELELVEIGDTGREYEDVDLPKDMTGYMVKRLGEIPFDTDYVYIGKKHIIETLPPASESMREYLEDDVYVGEKKCSIEAVLPVLESSGSYLEARINKYIEEDQKGMTIVTDVTTGETKVFLQYNYIPKYALKNSWFNKVIEDIPNDGNVEGVLIYNIEDVQLENVNRYKFLALLTLLVNRKIIFKFVNEDERKKWLSTHDFEKYQYEEEIASRNEVIILLNMLLSDEVFSISDNGDVLLSEDLLECFQYYLPDDWEVSNQKSYKMYLDKVYTSVEALNKTCIKEEGTGSITYTYTCDYLSNDERKIEERKVAENAVLAEHYNLEELKRKRNILKWPITRPNLFRVYMLQKFVEDYLWFEKGFRYNYKLFDYDRKTGYYEKHYGMASSKYSNKNFSWVKTPMIDNAFYVLGCQKAFINDNRVFLGEYTNEKQETLDIEIKIRNISSILTLGFIPESSKLDRLIRKMEHRWELKQKVDYGRYGTEYDYKYDDDRNAENKRNLDKVLNKWISNVRPQIHATLELEGKIIFLEETIECNNITIDVLLNGIKKIYKEYEKLTEGSLGIYAYLDEEIKFLEEEDDWREDYIHPRDYCDSSDWWE